MECDAGGGLRQPLRLVQHPQALCSVVSAFALCLALAPVVLVATYKYQHTTTASHAHALTTLIHLYVPVNRVAPQ